MQPIIAIPMGDPAGVGPEIIVKALSKASVYKSARPLVIGDAQVLNQSAKNCRLPLNINAVSDPSAGIYVHGTIDLIDMQNIAIDCLQVGKVQAMAGKAAFEYIEKAASLAMSGVVDAVATTPINKESLKAAAVPYIGHTEIFAGLTKCNNPLTMFQVLNLRVFFLTRHVSLRRACELVTEDSVYDFIIACARALTVLGVSEPCLAVAGLNPHCGEHGLFGDEEMREIEPAVVRARAKGINVTGPVAADSVFHFALKGRYDAVLSLYHDQGHIATKTLDFERTIAITNGLPFLRTSVDHGTAFDIAGTGTVSDISMLEAIRLAAEYAPMYKLANGK